MPLFQTNAGLIFFSHIPKCAGMSVEKSFTKFPTHLKNPNLHGDNQHRFPCSPQHFHAEIISKMFYVDAFIYSFVVVRNPFDRLISEYRFRSDIAKRQSRDILPFNIWLEKSLSAYHDNQYTLDNHLRPQVEFMLPNMKVFHLEEGLQEVFKSLKTDLPELNIASPVHVNASATVTPNLTPKSVDLIAQMYQEDFLEFGYSQNPKIRQLEKTA